MHIVQVDKVGVVHPEKALSFQHFFNLFKGFGDDHFGTIPEEDVGVIAARFAMADVLWVNEFQAFLRG